MSSRPPSVGRLREDLPPTISPATHPHAVRRTICIHAGKRRNLVINLDGTANQFSDRSTNVVEIFSRLIKDEDQLVYYDSGIGTYAPPSFRSLSYIKQVLDHAIDTAIAWNFEKIVHAAYKWLSENYQPGDRIFLFGFSRGAYQARVIAGMIETVGLLHKGNERQIPFAYELYSSVMDHNKRKGPGEDAPTEATTYKREVPRSEEKRRKQAKLCRQFKASLCHKDVKVHFVGAWDTVSSIGVLRGKSLPEIVSGMGHVCHFRHALALDERRVKFQPEFANGGLGPREGDVGDVKEVWFAGSHSDIGGGNISNEDLKNFGPALRWMTYEAMALGLRIEPYEGSWTDLELTKSLTAVWRILEIFPLPSLTYKDANKTSLKPHLCAGRKIQAGQLIHQSVLMKLPTTTTPTSHSYVANIPPYAPKAKLPKSATYTWETLFKELDNTMVVEKDPFENASHALERLEGIFGSADPAGRMADLHLIMTTLLPFAGNHTRVASLLEVPNAGKILMKAMCCVVLDPRTDIWRGFGEALIRLLARVWPMSRQLPTTLEPRIPPSKVYQWGLKLPKTFRDDLLKVLQLFACLGIQLEGEWITNVAFLRTNPPRIIFTPSLDSDGTTSTLVWGGFATWWPKVIAQVWGRRSTISRNGSHVAVGSEEDVTVIITATVPPLIMNGTDQEDPNDSGNVYSLCFTDNHQALATGHMDGCIKLWRREGDKWKVFKRFKGASRSDHLAFSRDGSRLAILALAHQVWTLADDSVVELEGSRGGSLSHAWSPAGNWIVSGTTDGSMKIHSIGQGKMEHRFKAHDHRLSSLAFRDDGQLVATGAHDNKIRIWRWGAWEKIWEFNIDEWVTALSFSPDGKLLASGGRKGALHLWDVDMKGDEKGY